MKAAAIIMAAGRGSRMTSYIGNKTLLPLIPESTPVHGRRPILREILDNLPEGPKAIVVNHKKEDIFEETRGLGITYCEQPRLNGTGGALIAAAPFIQAADAPYVIITMGDVPFIRRKTYDRLIRLLEDSGLAVLGFSPADKKQYGVLRIDHGRVKKIIEWKFWRHFLPEEQARLTICNSGIYAARKETLTRYLPVLSQNPQTVTKVINGKETAIEEFFLTDIVEYMAADGESVNCAVTEDETESMGIDDLGALEKAQRYFKKTKIKLQTNHKPKLQ